MAASRLMLLLKGAAFARRLGLGPVIDRVRPAVLRRVGRGQAEVRGIVLEAETVEDRMYYGQLQGGREGFMADLFERSVEPGSVVADVGANVGYFTLLAARRVGPEGAVYAFEPHARNVRRLGATSRATAPRARCGTPRAARPDRAPGVEPPRAGAKADARPPQRDPDRVLHGAGALAARPPRVADGEHAGHRRHRGPVRPAPPRHRGRLPRRPQAPQRASPRRPHRVPP